MPTPRNNENEESTGNGNWFFTGVDPVGEYLNAIMLRMSLMPNQGPVIVNTSQGLSNRIRTDTNLPPLEEHTQPQSNMQRILITDRGNASLYYFENYEINPANGSIALYEIYAISHLHYVYILDNPRREQSPDDYVDLCCDLFFCKIRRSHVAKVCDFMKLLYETFTYYRFGYRRVHDTFVHTPVSLPRQEDISHVLMVKQKLLELWNEFKIHLEDQNDGWEERIDGKYLTISTSIMPPYLRENEADPRWGIGHLYGLINYLLNDGVAMTQDEWYDQRQVYIDDGILSRPTVVAPPTDPESNEAPPSLISEGSRLIYEPLNLDGEHTGIDSFINLIGSLNTFVSESTRNNNEENNSTINQPVIEQIEKMGKSGFIRHIESETMFGSIKNKNKPEIHRCIAEWFSSRAGISQKKKFSDDDLIPKVVDLFIGEYLPEVRVALSAYIDTMRALIPNSESTMEAVTVNFSIDYDSEGRVVVDERTNGVINFMIDETVFGRVYFSKPDRKFYFKFLKQVPQKFVDMMNFKEPETNVDSESFILNNCSKELIAAFKNKRIKTLRQFYDLPFREQITFTGDRKVAAEIELLLSSQEFTGDRIE